MQIVATLSPWTKKKIETPDPVHRPGSKPKSRANSVRASEVPGAVRPGDSAVP